MMFGILGLKKFVYAVLAVPLPILTILFKIYVDRLYKRPLTMLSLRAARDMDEKDSRDQKRGQFYRTESLADTVHEKYMNDCFKIDWDQIEATCKDVQRVTRALELSRDEAVPLVHNLNITSDVEFYPVSSHALTKSDTETPIASAMMES